MKTLEEARKNIDEIDAQIAVLFEQRMREVADIAAYKQANDLPICDPAREQAANEAHANDMSDPTLQPHYAALRHTLVEESKKYQQELAPESIIENSSPAESKQKAEKEDTETPPATKEEPKSKKKMGAGAKIAIVIVIALAILVPAIALLGSGNDNYMPPESARGIDEESYKASCQAVEYEDLFRNPDAYFGDDITFTAQVFQVFAEDDHGADCALVYVTNTYHDYGYGYGLDTWDDLVCIVYEHRASDKLMEKDIITFYGSVRKPYTYETVQGSSRTVPLINAAYVDRE